MHVEHVDAFPVYSQGSKEMHGDRHSDELEMAMHEVAMQHLTAELTRT